MKRENLILISVLVFCFTTVLSTIAQDKTNYDSIYHFVENKDLPFSEKYKLTEVGQFPSAEKTIDIYKLLLSFAKKESDPKYTVQIYSLINNSYARLKQYGEGKVYLDSALLLEDKVADTNVLGYLHYQIGKYYGFQTINDKAHEHYYKAIAYFEKTGEKKNYLNQLYFALAVTYINRDDTLSTKPILDKMLAMPFDENSLTSQANTYLIASSYYSILWAFNKSNIGRLDSVIYYKEKNVELYERYPNKFLNIEQKLGAAYLNLATTYFSFDSIDMPTTSKAIGYLEKSKNFFQKNDTVSLIKYHTLKGRLFWHQKKYQPSVSESLIGLNCINTYKGMNVDAYRDYIYQDLVWAYEALGNYRSALEYERLYYNLIKKRRDVEEYEVIKEMEGKYEAEKKEAHILLLNQKQEAARKMIVYSIIIIAALLLALLLLIAVFRLKRKNLKQKVYESVLLAEQQREDLENNAKEKERLTQEYDKLKILSEQNKENAYNYEEQLQSLKQQIEQKNSKSLVTKLIERISVSIIEEQDKDVYIKRLSSVNVDDLESIFVSASEKLTSMDLKYIVCFFVDIDPKDIALIFNVEQSSVYTVRYRIKKKFKGKTDFKFLS